MKSNAFILIALLMTAILVFASCASEESAVSSMAGSEAYFESSAESSGVGTITPMSEDAIYCEPREFDDKNSYITITTETAEYTFIGEFCSGRYDTEFTGVENDEGGITLTLLDGRTMNLNYSEVVYDETDKIYRTEINGMDFMITEHYTSGNEFVQTFECIEMPEIFENTDIITTILIHYYPELGHGRIAISYVYEVDGDTLTLRYADGGVLTKTVKWDSSTGKYYFAE